MYLLNDKRGDINYDFYRIRNKTRNHKDEPYHRKIYEK